MLYDFKIRFEIAHIKLISKSLDILKSISKGELTRIESLFIENKKTYLENKIDLPEIFDSRMNKLYHFLADMQVKHYNNKFLNVLQLGDFGFLLVDVKQKFIDTGIIMKNKRINNIYVKLSENELRIINIACTLYWKILVGDFSYILSFKKYNTLDDFETDLFEAGLLARNLVESSNYFKIEDKFINRKAKWAYDICKCIDSLGNDDIIKNIGTLPRLKIIKNG
jgi:hypothetical protein